MESWVVLIVLVAIIGFQEFCRFRQLKNFEQERKALLDRIMARSFKELIEAQAAMEETRKVLKVVTVDDLKKEIAPPHEEGIPV
ncbi:MAG: hypothetical protein AB1585_10635 [Thermodesulfobacteriota bacterium]